MILTNPKERSRFFRFAVVGALGAVVDFGILNLLTLFAGVPVVLASVISFICAVVSNFLWNRYWTYPDSRSKPLFRQVSQFFLVSVVGLGIRTPLFALLEKWLTQVFTRSIHLPALAPNVYAHNLALAVVIGIVMLWNFFVNRFWTYSDIS